MLNKNGGDAGGDTLPIQVHQSSTERPVHQSLITPQAGEIIISIKDIGKEPEKKDNNGKQKKEDPFLSNGAPAKWLSAHLFKTRLFGRKLQSLRRKRYGIARSAVGREAIITRGWWAKFTTDAALSPGSELLLMFLIFLGLSILVFFICLATTKIALEGCNWTMCVHIRHGHSHGRSQHLIKIPTESYIRRSDCVYRRYVPHMHFPFLEIIHDLRFRQSALVEWRSGLRCMLFDMRRYVPLSDDCSAAYPKSLDERLGVPTSRSHLTILFPRRFARHYFSPVNMDAKTLAQVAGPAIAERCLVAQINVALLVDVRMESRRCNTAKQLLVDQLLAVSDPSYTRSRSYEMSDISSGTVVLYENWDRKADVSGKLIGESQANASVNNSEASTDNVEPGRIVATTPDSEVLDEADKRPMFSSSSGAQDGTVVESQSTQKRTSFDNKGYEAFAPLEKKAARGSLGKKMSKRFIHLNGRNKGSLDKTINASPVGNIRDEKASTENVNERSPTRDVSVQTHISPNSVDSKWQDLKRLAEVGSEESKAEAKARIKGKNLDEKNSTAMENYQETGELSSELEKLYIAMERVSPFFDKDSRSEKGKLMPMNINDVASKVSMPLTGTKQSLKNQSKTLIGEERGSKTILEELQEDPDDKSVVVMESNDNKDDDNDKATGNRNALSSFSVILDQKIGTRNKNLINSGTYSVDDGKFGVKAAKQSNKVKDYVALGKVEGKNGPNKENETASSPTGYGNEMRQSDAKAPAARNPIKREAMGEPQMESDVALVGPQQSVESLSLLNFVHGPVIRVLDSRDHRGHNRTSPPLLKGFFVKTEVRRYFLWLGRITRVCQLLKMPLSLK